MGAATVRGTPVSPAAITGAGGSEGRDAEDRGDPASEETLAEFIDRQLLPYLHAPRGEKFRLGHARRADEIFRHLKLRVAGAYGSAWRKCRAGATNAACWMCKRACNIGCTAGCSFTCRFRSCFCS